MIDCVIVGWQVLPDQLVTLSTNFAQYEILFGSKSKIRPILQSFSVLLILKLVFFRLYNIFEPSKIWQIWISHHTIHLKSCLSHTAYHIMSYSYCFGTWSKHHQSVCLKGMVVSIYAWLRTKVRGDFKIHGTKNF